MAVLGADGTGPLAPPAGRETLTWDFILSLRGKTGQNVRCRIQLQTN